MQLKCLHNDAKWRPNHIRCVKSFTVKPLQLEFHFCQKMVTLVWRAGLVWYARVAKKLPHFQCAAAYEKKRAYSWASRELQIMHKSSTLTSSGQKIISGKQSKNSCNWSGPEVYQKLNLKVRQQNLKWGNALFWVGFFFVFFTSLIMPTAPWILATWARKAGHCCPKILSGGRKLTSEEGLAWDTSTSAPKRASVRDWFPR